MQGDVVDVGAVVDAGEQVDAAVGSHRALVAGAHQVPGIDGFDQPGRPVEVGDEVLNLRGVFGEGTRLVADLPGEDGGGVLVALHYPADVLLEQGDGLRVGGESVHRGHVDAVALDGGMRLASGAGLLQPGAVAVRAPFPGVVEVEDGAHPAFLQFAQDDVHPLEILVGGQDAEVVETQPVQGVQFRGKAGRIGEGELRGVPHVGADEVAGLSITDDPPFLDRKEGGGRTAARQAEGGQQEDQDTVGKSGLFHVHNYAK